MTCSYKYSLQLGKNIYNTIQLVKIFMEVYADYYRNHYKHRNSTLFIHSHLEFGFNGIEVVRRKFGVIDVFEFETVKSAIYKVLLSMQTLVQICNFNITRVV